MQALGDLDADTARVRNAGLAITTDDDLAGNGSLRHAHDELVANPSR